MKLHPTAASVRWSGQTIYTVRWMLTAGRRWYSTAANLTDGVDSRSSSSRTSQFHVLQSTIRAADTTLSVRKLSWLIWISLHADDINFTLKQTIATISTTPHIPQPTILNPYDQGCGVLIFSDSDSGLKSDTDSRTCVLVTVYWMNDADRQILNRPI